MSETAKLELENELGGALPALELVSDADCARLLTMFQKARQEEKVALNQAIDDAIGALPWPLRGPAKKIMFGKRAG